MITSKKMVLNMYSLEDVDFSYIPQDEKTKKKGKNKEETNKEDNYEEEEVKSKKKDERKKIKR